MRDRQSAERLGETVRHLASTIGPRAPGSSEERSAAEYFRDRFEALGFAAAIETFPSASHRAGSATLSAHATGVSYECLASQFSPSADVAGPLVFVGDSSHPVPDASAGPSGVGIPTGSIAMFFASGSHQVRTDFLRRLISLGVRGVITISPGTDEIQTKLIRYPEIDIPAVSVSFRTAVQLVKTAGQVVRLKISEVKSRVASESQSYNVVATLQGVSDNWMVVSGHMDTAPGCPGAGDNASGAALVLELATRMRQRYETRRPAASIVFLVSGSEEYGMADGTSPGSTDFYRRRDSQVGSCVGHVELDGLGTVLGVPELYVYGPSQFRTLVLDDPGLSRYRIGGRLGTGGDRGAAEKMAVPYVLVTDIVFANFPQLHGPEDTVEYLSFDAMAGFADDAQRMIERLMLANPSFPSGVSEGVLIRAAREHDLDSILRITVDAYGSVSGDRMREEYFSEKLGGEPWQNHKSAAVELFFRANPFQVVVAEFAGRVVGYATYSFDASKGIAEIGDNAVAPEFQGRGIGTLLQREVDRRMRAEGHTRFTVTTLSNDLAARRLYEKLGYEKTAESCHYLRRMSR